MAAPRRTERGFYKAWGRVIAAQGVAVAMIDFRNCVTASSVPEVAQYPAGLNDCVSGLKWVHANAATLGIDPTRIIIAGESGGGNLTLAAGMKLKLSGDIGLIKGLYALCPYIAGHWPVPDSPSSVENNGILLDLHNNNGAIGYGIEAFNARDPLAWPGFAVEFDVQGLPNVVISVNECDPLRDEGVNFYRLLLRAGVTARCRQMMGTIHATEVFPAVCPDISRGHCQSKFYTACSRIGAGWSSTVFAHESPTGSTGFDAENGLYLFALTVPRREQQRRQLAPYCLTDAFLAKRINLVQCRAASRGDWAKSRLFRMGGQHGKIMPACRHLDEQSFVCRIGNRCGYRQTFGGMPSVKYNCFHCQTFKARES